jgi:cell wall-associated NlpC family hydrolase
MENNIANFTAYKPGDSYENWENKQIKHYVPSVGNIPEAARREMEKVAEQEKRATEIKNRTNYAYQRLDDMRSFMDESPNSDNFSTQIDLIAEVFAYNQMDPANEDFFWELIEYLGTPYSQSHTDEEGKQYYADCGGFARVAYRSVGIYISRSGYGRPTSQMWTADQETWEGYSVVFDPNSKTSLGETLYNKDTYDGNPNPKKRFDEVGIQYQVGDVFYYDLSSASDKPGVDHVGIFLGYNQKGEEIFIDTATESRDLEIIGPSHSRYNNRTGYGDVQGVRRYF